MIVILIHRWHLLMRFQYYSELTKCDYLTIEWFIACKYGFAINPSCFERSNIRQQFQLFNEQRIIIFKMVITLSNNKNAVCYQLSPDIYSSSSSLSIVWYPIVYCSYFILLIILLIIVKYYLLFEYNYFLINLLELILFDIWKELVGRGHYDF